MANSKRKCRQCGEYNRPDSMVRVPLGYFCDANCAFTYGSEKAIQKAEKARKTNLKQRKEALKSKGDYTKIAQDAFNGYINARDKNAKRKCISCSRPLIHGVRRHGDKGGVDASHYRSRGAAPHLRFHLGNVHSSCVKCNRDLSGNIVEYRKGLIERYGVDYVEAIEADQRPRHYSIDDLKRIAKIFRRRTRLYKQFREKRELIS